MSPDKKNLIVTQGLNRKSKIFPVLYYLHYFFIRTFISLMIVLTPFVSSIYLWIIVLVVQTLITLAHLIKLYDSWSLYLQGIIRELYILSVVGLLFATQLTDQTSEE